MELFILFVAMVLLFVGHLFKVLRWKQIVEVYEEPGKKDLFRALSVGYLINFIMPYRIGDIVRAFLAGRKMKNGFSFSCSSVLVDRYLDVIMVGLIFMVLSVCGFSSDDITESTMFYIALAFVLVLLAFIAIKCSKVIKNLMKWICSLFNTKIELNLLFFGWSVITAFKDTFKRVSKVKLLLYTCCMWAGYLSSYYAMSVFITRLGQTFTLSDVFTLLFSRGNLDVASVQMSLKFSAIGLNAQSLIWIYLLFPLIALLVLSFIPARVKVEVKAGDNYTVAKKLNLLPQINEKDRLNFLENYFSGKKRDYLEKYLEINRDINIIQDYSAGSNATTMLCIDEDKTFYRKYAFGDDGDKLNEQLVWLRDHEQDLPLCEIVSEQSGNGYCCYDMEYSASAVGLFQYIHSMPFDKSWSIIQQSFEALERGLYKKTKRPLDTILLKEYISEKVTGNVKKIEAAKELRGLAEYDEIIINGVKYKNLHVLKKYLKEEHLYSIFNQDTCADIHGDMTIENIICYNNPVRGQEFYIIDPNTGNKHDSPNLDYSKLLQSIHGGYEFLMKTQTVNVNGNHIEFLFTKSHAYNEMFWRYKTYLEETFSKEKVKSIFYHEIIHWLRLMPYKFVKNGKRSILFYAGLIMVFNDVVNWYEEEKGE